MPGKGPCPAIREDENTIFVARKPRWNLKGLRFWHEVAEEHAWQRAKVQVGFGGRRNERLRKTGGGGRQEKGGPPSPIL